MGVAAILLASGYGRRYGSNKLLDTWEGVPLYRPVQPVQGQVFRSGQVAVPVFLRGAHVQQDGARGVAVLFQALAQRGAAGKEVKQSHTFSTPFSHGRAGRPGRSVCTQDTRNSPPLP